MLTIYSDRDGAVTSNCEGASRRDFLRVGSLGMAGLTLPNLLRARAAAATGEAPPLKHKSVIWLWLAGGPTHVETFDPKMTAPVEYRSMTGEVKTCLPGVSFGGNFAQLAKVADRMSIVRSFAHGNSSHGTATSWVMTGYNDRNMMKPSLGSIIARAKGITNPETGMPSYVNIGRIRSDGPGWLGAAYSPFDPAGRATKNMTAHLPEGRMQDRRSLLNQLDTIRRDIDRSGKMEGIDGFEQQAFELIMGSAQDAFDVNKEDAKVRERYGKGLGSSLLKARRMAEAGCAFITVSYGGWDMHNTLVRNMQRRGNEVDQGVSALIEDLEQRGMLDDTLVVVTGEFGRTPRINKRAGRDHWGRLCTLALAGGGLSMGQVIGDSSRKIETPASNPIKPQDLLATIMRMYGISHRIQITDPAGRPTYLIEEGEPIPELIS